jgi:hypothetical protein
MVTYEVEKLIKKGRTEDRIAGVYVLDSLCRQHTKEKELFAKRFAVRLKETLSFMKGTSHKDKTTLSRMLNEWHKKQVNSSYCFSLLICIV